jgi:hypothetical protein
MTESNFRALCVELHAAVQLYTGQNPAAAGMPANELVARLMDAMANTAAALAQPEPVAPTDEELLMLMPETMRDEFSYAAKTCSDAMGGRVKPGIFRVALNTAALEYARAVLARWGTANNTIIQED